MSDDNSDLDNVAVEEVKVETKPTATKTVIGSKEFNEEFVKELKSGQPWRSPASLATKMGVDAVDLVKWMDRVPELARKPGKEDGVFYYGIAMKSDPADKESKKLTRPVVTEEDRYCAAMLHMTYGQLLRTLEKYAIRIHDKSPEAFTALMNARDRLSAGTVLFHNTTKVEPEKLPKL